MEAADGSHACSFFVPHRPLRIPRLAVALRNRLRAGKRRDVADRRCARRKRRSRDQELIFLGLSRTTLHATTRKGIPVGIRSGETVRECLQEGDDLVLLLIRQAELTNRHVDVVRHFGLGPAVEFFGLSCRAMSGSDIEHKFLYVARVIAVDELLQALDVAVVKELLLEIGPGASVVGHCGGVTATLRAVITCIWPSVVGANFLQVIFGLGQEPGPLLRNVPNPKSLKPKPYGFPMNLKESGVG
jgi:hypothetical protein